MNSLAVILQFALDSNGFLNKKAFNYRCNQANDNLVHGDLNFG